VVVQDKFGEKQLAVAPTQASFDLDQQLRTGPIPIEPIASEPTSVGDLSGWRIRRRSCLQALLIVFRYQSIEMPVNTSPVRWKSRMLQGIGGRSPETPQTTRRSNFPPRGIDLDLSER